jgi:hypothetical protein
LWSGVGGWSSVLLLLELSIRESLLFADVEIVFGTPAVRIDKEGKLVEKFYIYIAGVGF